MPRRNKKDRKVYRIRTKSNGGFFGSQMFLGPSARQLGSRHHKGRIVSITKVSSEEILRLGEFFRLGETLMKEFRKSDKEATSGTAGYRQVRQNTPEKGRQLSEKSESVTEG